ncbi:MAG: hypothetical protein K9G11_01595 [Rickettsiaceae bacterium]|nr:hypothetical protein [Rickettsiaceae bacterium]
MNSFVIKLQAPFERLKSINDNPEISLRKAIILQAIIDASSCSEKRQEKKIAQEARDWLFGDSEHFKQLCSEANLADSYVVNIATKMIKLQENKIKKNKAQKVAKLETILAKSIILYTYSYPKRFR